MRKVLNSANILAISIFIGIVFPAIAELLRPLLFVSVFFLMLFSLLAIHLRSTMRSALHSGRILKIMSWQMFILPLLLGLVHLLWPFSGHQYTKLLLLSACGGTIFGAPAFAKVMKLDSQLTLLGVILATLLIPVVLPLFAALFLGKQEPLDYVAYLVRLLIFIVLPFILVWIYQLRFPQSSDDHGKSFERMSVIFLIIFGIAVMEGIGYRFVNQTLSTLGLLLFAFFVHLLFFFSTKLVFRSEGPIGSGTAGLLSSYRNLALLLAVGGSILPKDFIVFVALWQIPMYVMPSLARFIYKKVDTGLPDSG